MEPVVIEYPLGDNPPKATLYYGDNVLDTLHRLPDKSVQMVATSPPYWGLRDYLTPPIVWGGVKACDHDWQEQDDYRASPARTGDEGLGFDDPEVTQAQRHRKSAICSKCGAWLGQLGLEPTPEMYVSNLVEIFQEIRRVLRDDGVVWLNQGDSYSEKDLVGIPWMTALALRADGWYLRSEVIWCLSGGTWLYARTQKGDMPMMIKDMARLDPATVQLWNGQGWTQLLGMSRSARQSTELELVLRSGERISCTPTHQWPTNRGLLAASDLVVGDVLDSTTLPEPESPRDCVLDLDAAWFAGLYLAEGSRSSSRGSGPVIQLAGHAEETARWDRVQTIAHKFGGSATCSVEGNNQSIRVYGKILNAILDELVSGKVSGDKGFAPVVWRYSNPFIAAMLDGYLSGDGSDDKPNNRWRLGFTRNYNLERDLRVACARLGYALTLNPSTTSYNGKRVPIFHGEIRKTRSGHHNERPKGEILKIRKARCRFVWDLGVADEPHTFALASGVLTHNSKPNCMPEPVQDRPSKSHETIFLLTKKARYFYDQDAIREPHSSEGEVTPWQERDYDQTMLPDEMQQGVGQYGKPVKGRPKGIAGFGVGGRNKRTVWTVNPKPYKGAHFATWPGDLVEIMIKAGSRERDVVLDPFSGSATTGAVALRLGRDYIGIDLQETYLPLACARLRGEAAPQQAASPDEAGSDTLSLFA